MSSLVVIAFEAPNEAAEVLERLKAQTKYGNIKFDDVAVVSKELDGKVHVKNHVSHTTMTATGIGALLGLLLTGVLFPIGGLLLGAGGGALVGRLMNLGVDGDFVKDVTNSLQPGTSALFVVVHEANPAVVRAVLEEHPGKILQSTLTPEAEAALREALKE
jgi:uncharacterized membrane protein